MNRDAAMALLASLVTTLIFAALIAHRAGWGG